MAIIGLIAEYNPFHLGHKYQIESIKKQYPNDTLVVVMSGNIVQRGEFSILDKWQRAEIAIKYGADLVLELPLLASLQSADYFAKWSVDLLHRIGADILVFGTEFADTNELISDYYWIKDNQADIDNKVKTFLNQGKSYAFSTYEAIRQLDEEHALRYSSNMPNHLLGLKYIEANEQYLLPMECQTIVRKSNYLSGSQIRNKIKNCTINKDELPEETYNHLLNQDTIEMNDYFELIKYQLISQSAVDISEIQSVREGFEKLLLKEIYRCNNYNEFVTALTSKRWTKASVQRVLMNILLNIHQEEWQEYEKNYQQNAIVRVLGYRNKGRYLLSALRNTKDILLFSNLTQNSYNQYKIMVKADRIYQLRNKNNLEQNISRFPIKY